MKALLLLLPLIGIVTCKTISDKIKDNSHWKNLATFTVDNSDIEVSKYQSTLTGSWSKISIIQYHQNISFIHCFKTSLIHISWKTFMAFICFKVWQLLWPRQKLLLSMDIFVCPPRPRIMMVYLTFWNIWFSLAVKTTLTRKPWITLPTDAWPREQMLGPALITLVTLSILLAHQGRNGITCR